MQLGEGQASGQGLTSGKPQSHCSPGSTNVFPHKEDMGARLGSRSKRQLPIPSRRAFSRACRLQLLKFKPGRKLGRGARRAGLEALLACLTLLHPNSSCPPSSSSPQLLTLWRLP